MEVVARLVELAEVQQDQGTVQEVLEATGGQEVVGAVEVARIIQPVVPSREGREVTVAMATASSGS